MHKRFGGSCGEGRRPTLRAAAEAIGHVRKKPERDRDGTGGLGRNAVPARERPAQDQLRSDRAPGRHDSSGTGEGFVRDAVRVLPAGEAGGKMKPFRLKSPVPSEASEQRVLFEWAELNSSRIPELICLFSVPNGGSRNLLEAINLKRTGTKSGIPDVVLPVPRGPFHGLFVEMKRESLRPKTARSRGGISDSQLEWIIRLRSQGYAVQICYGSSEAIATILRYLSGCFVPEENQFPISRVTPVQRPIKSL